jgi:16S rRNA (cytosine967-C5)-methyltransferase
MSGHAEWLTPKGDLQTFPSYLSEEGGMDGFFAARLRRIS